MPALRPEGKSGALTRTLASHLAYYRRWAKTWEFQALLKARPVAGDLELGASTCGPVTDGVGGLGPRRVRRRRPAHAPPGGGERSRRSRSIDSSSSGPGGLRDIEFAVQLLQLVHGRVDETLAQRQHPAGARCARRRRVRGSRRCGCPERCLPVPSAARAPTAAAPAPAHAPDADRSGRAARARSFDRVSPRSRSRSSPASGAVMRSKSDACTRSCSTDPCSTPSPASTPARRD